jgi:23S rRNA pseudouridine2605 synthase
MNNKAIIKKGGARPTSSRPSSNKPKPAMQKRAQGPKVKINTKVAEVVSDKVEKKPNQAPKRPKVKDEIRLNKYIANSGACSRRDADIYIQSGNVKVNGILLLKWDIWLNWVIKF